METLQQITAKISAASRILILVAADNGDSLAAGLALKAFLAKLEKDATVFAASAPASRFSFLPGINDMAPQLDLTKNLVIDVSMKKSAIAELSYKKTGDKLSIFLKPTSGSELTPADISFGAASFPYDLIVLVGIQSLEQLGEFYSKNTSLFFETTMVNLDFRAGNENYGELNLVNLSATSCSEIMFELISRLESSLIDETVATQLLAGIIAETNSFQHIRTTPQTFLAASQLVSLGARQQEIVTNLYKTKSLGLLKLWGRVLATIKQDQGINLVYSTASANDLAQSGATSEDAEHIIKEMAGQLSFGRLFLFLREETPTRTIGYFHATLPLDLRSIFAQFDPQALTPQSIRFAADLGLAEAETQVRDLVRQSIAKLNISA